MLRAVIFDFNGVIVDDEGLHLQAFQQILRQEGISLTEADYYARYLGMDDRGCFRAAHRAVRRDLDDARLERLIERKAVYYRSLIDHGVVMFPGVARAVSNLSSAYPLAIASGALREEIDRILEKCALTRFFHVIVSAEDVREGKPEPQIFLRALELLNRQQKDAKILAEQCLVIEDSREGILAAKRAGMKCLAVAHSYPASELEGADAVVESIERVDLSLIDRFFPKE
jgi:HAD superfamily hydrolase (TIGR01509 family)